MQTFAVGQTVRAFHPRKFGVINHGTIVKVGRVYLTVDFGALNGGTFKIRKTDVVERV